ncbi:MAG: DNA-directed DNA polymerase [Nanoarchaeota archaeon]
MASLEFYPLDIDFDEEGVIRLVGITKNNEKVCVYDGSFKPYFWIINNEPEKIKNDMLKISEDGVKVLDAEVHEKNYLGDKVRALKVHYNNPKRIRTILDVLDENLVKIEVDINFAKRYLIDNNITMMTLTKAEGELMNNDYFDYCVKGRVKQESQEFYDNPKALVFDIEVYGSHGGSDKVKNDPILMIGLLGENLKKVITWKKFEAQNYVEFVNSEAEMIERFVNIIKEYSPSILIGYNSDNFDFPYIKSRAEKYGIRLNLGMDNSILKFKAGMESTAKINGVIHLDLLKFIRKNMSANLQLESYSLDSVAKELLQEGKKEIDVDDIMEAWDNIKDLEKFSEYNMKDVDLTLRIFHKVYPIMSEIVKLVGINMFDVCRISYGQLVENYLIRRAPEYNELIPNKPLHHDIGDRREQSYQGAFVMEPKIGFYENVAFFDFRSLYPSIIIAKNIYPGNLNHSGEGYETPAIEENGFNRRYYFDTKDEGFIPQIVKDLIVRRNRIKEIMKKEDNITLKARSYALKTIANSTYGMYGFFGARYYSKECASSITAFGRKYIKDTIEKAEKSGFLVIYSDTDSIAVALRDKTEKEALNFLQEINNELPSLMELELEKFYTRGIFVSKKGEQQGAKKKYALIDENGKMKIIGFETIRKDWSVLARETQLNVIELILKQGDYKEALEYTKKVIKDIKNKDIELKKMIIREQLKMPLDSYKQIGPHVAVARRMKQIGMDVSPGANIYFIVSDEQGLIRDKAKIPSECKNYDANYYIENQIMPSLEKIFEVFGISKDEILIKEQTKLGEF